MGETLDLLPLRLGPCGAECTLFWLLSFTCVNGLGWSSVFRDPEHNLKQVLRFFELSPLFLLSVHGHFAHMYVCVLHTCSAYRDQKKASDSLGLELHIALCHHVAAGN